MASRKCVDILFSRIPVLFPFLVLVSFCQNAEVVTGSPCTDNTHRCSSDQTCVESNTTAGYVCHCSLKDEQIAANQTCVKIPDSQRLYLATPVDVTAIDYFYVRQILATPEIGEPDLERLYENITIQSFKGVKIVGVISGIGSKIGAGIVVYSVLFTETITPQIRQEVALAVLAMEARGYVIIINKTALLDGMTGIYNTEKEISYGIDAVDWCSSSRLYSCPSHSKCNDTGIRYICVCDKGYFRNGSECSKTVRLVNGTTPSEGRLEYNANGVWHTVCGIGFGSREASVVCQQLGYPRRGAQYFANTTYSEGAEPIYNNDFDCSGAETLLSDCPTGKLNDSCGHEQAIAIVCDAECPDDYHFGPNCTQSCTCPINTTESCDRLNGTCFCKAGWEGVTCSKDVDECALGTHDCARMLEVCVNEPGGFRCACSVYAKRNASGICVGTVTLTGPRPFSTDGSRDMTLICFPGNVTERVNFTWSTPCVQQRSSTCTFRPRPPEDDGIAITCTVTYSDGQLSSAVFNLDLNYPPTSPPVIQGYSNGDILYSGNSLVMTCAVQGGKPLVSSVVFSCPGHNDRSGDIFDLTQVQSVLTFDPLRVSDDRIYCVCTAVWMNTDWYTQSATRTLIVNGTDPSQSVNVPLIAGTVSGGTFLVIIIVVVIVVYRRRAGTYDKPSHNSETKGSPYTPYDPYAVPCDIDESYDKIGDTIDPINPVDGEYFEPIPDMPSCAPKPCIPALDSKPSLPERTKDRGDYLHATYNATEDSCSLKEVEGIQNPVYSYSQVSDASDDITHARIDQTASNNCSLKSDSGVVDDIPKKDYLHPISDLSSQPDTPVQSGSLQDVLQDQPQVSYRDDIMAPTSFIQQKNDSFPSKDSICADVASHTTVGREYLISTSF